MPLLSRTARALRVVVLATVLFAPARASAQYFGRNKVQYRTFDFRVLKTPRFDIYFYPEEAAAVRDAARMAERAYARYSRVFDYEFERRQPLILYASHPEFQQTAALSGDIGESTGGVTEAFKQRMILPFSESYEKTDQVLSHELVHAFQYDITGVGRAGGGIEQAAQRSATPLWFTEGMAEYLALGPVSAHTAMWLRDAALTGRVPTIEELTRNPTYFPYRWGQAFWAYVGGRWGDAVIGQILKQVGQGVPYPDAFQRILNTSLEEIGRDWAASIRATYLPLLTGRGTASEEATALITNKKRGGRTNVSPSISPDGKRMVFLSELNFIDIQLFLADAETGRVIRRLVKGSAFDPHFGSLRYIKSAGTWSPDQRRFAFSALREARDEVVILDVDRAKVLKEYAVEGVGEISNPTWSPDGRTIVFSGLHGGITDLYALDVETGRSRQLTNDRFADLQPAFSPDGRTIAFVTDRGPGTDLDALRYGGYRLALYDVASGKITLAPAQAGERNINPAWTPDGRGLYFVSNRTGIPNIYRLELATGELRKVTNIFTGVSGITAESPTMSSALRANRIVFSAYERNFGFNIYKIDDPAKLAGAPVPEALVASAPAAPLPAVLPPAPRPPEPAFNRVATLLADPNYGLPSAQQARDSSWRVVPYRPRLSLDYLGQPQVGVGIGGGIYNRGGLYGGISGIFSDVLGRHTVYGVLQAQGRLDQTGFSTVYINQRQRLNYGAFAQRIPFIAGAARRVGFDPSTNEIRDQLLILRYFDTRLGGLAQYPFSRVQRLQFSGGFRRIGQDVLIQEYACPAAPNGSGCLGGAQYRQSKESGQSFNLVESSVALIYDSSLSGYTSPFTGQRYHFELAPTFGTGQFVEATADYRRYFFLRPITLAFRGLHFGRYGRNQNLFGQQFLGYPFFMRGYDYYSVRNNCSRNRGSRDCAVLNELFGSRIAVANAELRVPILARLIGQVGLSPVEGVAFLDAGVAWGKVRDASGAEFSTSPVFRRGIQNDPAQRGILTSGGVGARVNLLGYAVVEVDYVKAFERDRGWAWQFSFQPGF